MIVLLVISIACFFALFLAMLTLLRRAAVRGAADRRAIATSRRVTSGTSVQMSERSLVDKTLHTATPLSGRPALRDKRPDWRFLVRDGRRPFPSGQVLAPTRRPPQSAGQGKVRADWAHYNKDLGDLKDPYQAPPSTARRA